MAADAATAAAADDNVICGGINPAVVEIDVVCWAFCSDDNPVELAATAAATAAAAAAAAFDEISAFFDASCARLNMDISLARWKNKAKCSRLIKFCRFSATGGGKRWRASAAT